MMIKKKRYWFIDPDPTFRNNLMAFGYECSKGWHPIIEDAFDEMSSIIRDMDAVSRAYMHDNFRILQVKEKYGGLRIYVSAETDEIADIIKRAEDRAYRTCEECGEYGVMTIRGGWYQTLCEPCAEKRGAKIVKES